MATQRACDHCRFFKPGIRRYGLSAQVPTDHRRPDGQKAYATRGAGGIDLCPDCWETIGKPKMNSTTFDARTAPFPKYG